MESTSANNPNWTLINKCPVWSILGVGECDNCPHVVKCWGKDSQLPEMKPQAIEVLQEVINGNN